MSKHRGVSQGVSRGIIRVKTSRGLSFGVATVVVKHSRASCVQRLRDPPCPTCAISCGARELAAGRLRGLPICNCRRHVIPRALPESVQRVFSGASERCKGAFRTAVISSGSERACGGAGTCCDRSCCAARDARRRSAWVRWAALWPGAHAPLREGARLLRVEAPVRSTGSTTRGKPA